MEESAVMRQEITGRKCSGGNCLKGQAEKEGKKLESKWGYREALASIRGLDRARYLLVAVVARRMAFLFPWEAFGLHLISPQIPCCPTIDSLEPPTI
jgi:hypothetical protein